MQTKQQTAWVPQIGLYIGAGLFLAFPLPKNGLLSDIAAGLGFMLLAYAVFYRIKLRRNRRREQADFAGFDRIMARQGGTRPQPEDTLE